MGSSVLGKNFELNRFRDCVQVQEVDEFLQGGRIGTVFQKQVVFFFVLVSALHCVRFGSVPLLLGAGFGYSLTLNEFLPCPWQSLGLLSHLNRCDLIRVNKPFLTSFALSHVKSRLYQALTLSLRLLPYNWKL